MSVDLVSLETSRRVCETQCMALLDLEGLVYLDMIEWCLQGVIVFD